MSGASRVHRNYWKRVDSNGVSSTYTYNINAYSFQYDDSNYYFKKNIFIVQTKSNTKKIFNPFSFCTEEKGMVFVAHPHRRKELSRRIGLLRQVCVEYIQCVVWIT